ncbi:MAG: hypothetical protein ACRD9S_05345 [Pyrinomonadaceae bacterium]
MKIDSQHIPFAKLVDLAEKRAAADERTASMAHLSSCSVCAQQVERVEQVLGLMKTDTATDAPRDILAYAVNIFRGRENSREPSLLKRIVAALSFDSSSNLAPVGVRSGQSTSRQLLYSAEENDIDLRIMPEQENWIVTGQVLGEDCVGGRIELEGRSGELTAADLNDLCEFILPPVPAGSYRVRLRLGNLEVEIPQLELRA